MRARSLFVLLLVLATRPPVLAQGAPPAGGAPPAAPAVPELRNQLEPLEGVRTGGLAADADAAAVLGALARDGFRVYVDLRAVPEEIETARAAASAAGIDYVSIPVGGESDYDLGAVRALDAVLADPARGPAVVACASGNRSGALLALRAFWLERTPAEEALELGRRAGLTRAEPTVRTLLGLPPLPPDDAEPTADEPRADRQE